MRATILLADYANLTGNGKLNVMGVFRQINANQFPCRHLLMCLVIKLQTEPIEDLRGERILVTRLVDADGSVLRQLEIPFKFPERSGGLRPEVNFILQINNLDFPYAGEYVWVVFVNDENVGQFEFYLNQ
ncbi:MAG: hypothetical protein ACE5FD_08035 [Anaerolineae bacterium]